MQIHCNYHLSLTFIDTEGSYEELVMPIRYLIIVIVVFIASSCGVLTIAQAQQDPCKCVFDTTAYSAECECALTCSQSNSGKRHCKIVCDGKVRNAYNRQSDFGSWNKYQGDLEEIIAKVRLQGFRIFSDNKFAREALPKLLRAGYIDASFISDIDKVQLDYILKIVFERTFRNIQGAFVCNNNVEFKQTIDKAQIYVRLKYIEVFVEQFQLRLIYMQ